MKMSSRTRNLRSPLRDIVAHAKKIEAAGKKMYYFNIGDPNKFDFDTPDHIKNALTEAVKGKVGHYSASEGDNELKQSIIQRERKFNGISLELDNINITHGISEAQHELLHTVIEHGTGDEILLPCPSYPPYIEYTKFAGGVPVEYKMDEENDWQADLDHLRHQITDKTKLIVIISPNNPCGSMFSKKTLQSIINIAGEHNLPILSDEIYDELVFGDTEYHGVASLAKDVPVIIFNGFSKAHLMPGWRVGYTYFYDSQNRLDELKTGFDAILRQRLSASTPLMKACARAFDDNNHIKEINKKLKERAEFAYKRLNDIHGIITNKPNGAFYIFPKVEINGSWKNDIEFVLDVMKETGCVFPYGSGFGSAGNWHFRSVILPPVDVMSEAFDKLDEFMKKKA
ncbi:aminotransferase class I/II-fold pyridoxal phosphate-dependent enzyme [Candidatus Aenigmatarchaeota archaeon]